MDNSGPCVGFKHCMRLCLQKPCSCVAWCDPVIIGSGFMLGMRSLWTPRQPVRSLRCVFMLQGKLKMLSGWLGLNYSWRWSEWSCKNLHLLPPAVSLCGVMEWVGVRRMYPCRVSIRTRRPRLGRGANELDPSPCRFSSRPHILGCQIMCKHKFCILVHPSCW